MFSYFTQCAFLPGKILCINTHPAKRYFRQDIMVYYWHQCKWQTHFPLLQQMSLLSLASFCQSRAEMLWCHPIPAGFLSHVCSRANVLQRWWCGISNRTSVGRWLNGAPSDWHTHIHRLPKGRHSNKCAFRPPHQRPQENVLAHGIPLEFPLLSEACLETWCTVRKIKQQKVMWICHICTSSVNNMWYYDHSG